MLYLNNYFLDKEVLSLQTTTPIASIVKELINPDNLKIEGFYCKDRFSKKILVLLVQDIREIIDDGYIVNDQEALADPEDLVKLREIINIDFNLLGKKVETISKDKIGKVSDYSVDSSSMFIQKLYVQKPLLKNLNNGTLIIGRDQINEITPNKIIINDLLSPSLQNANAIV